MKVKDYLKNHKVSIRQMIKFLFITLAVGLVVLLAESIVLLSLYAAKDNKLFLFLFIIITAILAIAIGVYVVYTGLTIYKIFYKQLYTTTLRNFGKMTSQKTHLERYDVSSPVYEFSQLNDYLDEIDTHYNNVLVTNKNIGIGHINLDYNPEYTDVVSYSSFVKYYTELIFAAQNFRNAFILLTYDLKGANGIEKDEIDNLYKNIRNVFNYPGLLIADNSQKSEFIVYIPNFDSFSKLKEDIKFVLQNVSLIRHTSDLTNVVLCHASIVVYPYSNLDDIIADLRYANRQGKVINFYLPNKQQNANDNMLHTSININNVSRFMEKFSSIDVAHNDTPKTMAALQKVMVEICQYYNFDKAGYAILNDLDDTYEVKYAYAAKGQKSTFYQDSLFPKDLVQVLNDIKDEDKSYYFSSREHVNPEAGRYFDRYGIDAGHFYIINNNEKAIGLIYFVKNSEMFLDTYLKEAMLIFSYYIASIIKEIQDKEEVNVTNNRFNNVLKISGYNLYTIEKSSYRLRMVSDSLGEIAKDAKVGALCYKALYGKNKPCENCPLTTGKKMNEQLGDHIYESSLALNVGRSREAQILLTPNDGETAIRDRFDRDFLVNSYYSFCQTLQNNFVINGKGYILLLSIDNFEQLMDYYSNEEFAQYIRRFTKDIRQLQANNFNIYSYNSTTLAIILPEVGKNDAIELIEKIYPLSKKNYMEDKTETELKLSYFAVNYPAEYANAYDLVKGIEKKINDYRSEAGKDMVIVPETKYTRCACHEQFILSIIDNFIYGNNSFSVRLQPIVNKRRRITSAELLLRFSDSYRSVELNTFEVIKIATQNDKMPTITNLLVQYIGDLYKNYGAKLFKKYGLNRLSTNTDYSFFTDLSFVTRIGQLQEECEMPEGFLTFEIAEKEIQEHYDSFEDITKLISRNHINLVCDNYTGSYLSLEKIKNLGFSAIKIDRSIVSQIGTDPSKLYGIKTVLESAKDYELNAVIVGIETLSQFNLIKDDQHTFDLQGFYFHKPMDTDTLLATLEKVNR